MFDFFFPSRILPCERVTLVKPLHYRSIASVHARVLVDTYAYTCRLNIYHPGLNQFFP